MRGRPLRGVLLVLVLFAASAVEALAVENPARKANPARAAASPAPDVLAQAHHSGSEATGRRRGARMLRGTVNINSADEATLELLPGVGEATAGKIVALRKQRPFKRVDDITRVKGIGRKKLAHMRPFLSVSGPSTLVQDEEPLFEAGE